MFDHKHYVPILKTKAGERQAIAHLKAHTKSQITPLFELHKHKSLPHAPHADEICECLVSIWGTDRPLFLDTIWLHKEVGDPGILHDVFNAARKVGLKAIPVVRIDFNAAFRAAVKKIVKKDGQGCLLRINRPNAQHATDVASILADIGLTCRMVHLMIDYQAKAMQLISDIPKIAHLTQWKTFIAASGVFPRSLSSISTGVWHKVPRDDWESWLNASTTASLERRPTYSDYTIRDPSAPATFGAPSVNLRYSKSPHWLVRIGGRVNAGASKQMYKVCQDLIRRPEYDGVTFSAGDQAISDTAASSTNPGNATQWIQWCINHHIEFTVQDIRNHPAL